MTSPAPANSAWVSPAALRRSARHAGRLYLTRSGIARRCCLAVERQDILHYAPGMIAFAAHDSERVPRNVVVLRYADHEPPRWQTKTGSDPRFPVVLRGDARSVWFVGNGLEALALWTLFVGMGRRVPTTVVNGPNSSVRTAGALLREVIRPATTVMVVPSPSDSIACPSTGGTPPKGELVALQAIAMPGCRIAHWLPFDGSRTLLEMLTRQRAYARKPPSSSRP